MNDLEKVEYINVLFDIYKNLLTEKQKDIMERYYTYNLSLKEISEDLNISRSAAFDTIEHASKKLYDFESKLKIHEKRMKVVCIIKESKLSNDEKEKLINEVLYGI